MMTALILLLLYTNLILRVLYTIVEWLLKSARQDNCVAALNGLCGIEQIRPIKCPAVTLLYDNASHEETIMPPTKKRKRSWINNIPFFAKQAKLCSATLGKYT